MRIDRRGVADAEPQDGDRNPGDRRDRPQDLEQRIQRDERAVHPAHPQPERDRERHRDAEARAHAHQRRADVFPQRAVARQLQRAGRPPPRAWEISRSCVATTTAHQMPTTTAITTIDGNACLRPFILFCSPTIHARASESSTTASPDRLHQHRHLSARVRRAREVVARRLFERQPETLAGHHDRRPEHLRHVVEIAQQQHVVESERQADLRRQDLHLVAGHAARVGALRNLEQLVARRHLDGREARPAQHRQHREQRHRDPPRAFRSHWRSRILRSCTKSSDGVAVRHDGPQSAGAVDHVDGRRMPDGVVAVGIHLSSSS